MLSAYRATQQEIQKPLPGDDILPCADLSVNSAFTLDATPEEVWPWIVQAGKGRAGWYLPGSIERFTPQRWHGYRSVDESLQGLAVGDKMGDWSGKDVELKVVELEPEQSLVYASRWKDIDFTWAMVLDSVGESATRVHSRTRLTPVKHKRAATLAGGFLDRAVAGAFAKGLKERMVEKQQD